MIKKCNCPDCNLAREQGIVEGKRQEKDIKADHLAGHYIAGKKEGRQDMKKEIIEIIDKEIKSIEKLNKDKTIIVNHNFWIAHINQLNELKQQIQEEKKQ